MESTIAIIVLGILCMVLTFVDDIRDCINRIANKNNENKSDQVKEFEKANPNIPPHILHHVAGQKNAWNLIKLAIYKMYLDGELLNCESIIVGVEKNMQLFTDQNMVDALSKDFENYIRQVLNPPTPATGIGTGDQNKNPPLPPNINGET